MNKLRVYKATPNSEKSIIAECFIETCVALMRLHFIDSVKRYGKDNVIIEKDHDFSVYDRGNGRNRIYSLYIEPI